MSTDPIAITPWDEMSDEEWLTRRAESAFAVAGSSPWLHGDRLPTRSEALRLIGEVLYAVQFPNGSIKIGWSRNLWRRLLRYDLHGSTLLAIHAGDRAAEQTLHDSLADHIEHGREWYNPTPEVMAVVNSWRSELGLAAA